MESTGGKGASTGLTSALLSFAPQSTDEPLSARVRTTKLSSPRPVIATAEGWAAARAVDVATTAHVAAHPAVRVFPKPASKPSPPSGGDSPKPFITSTDGVPRKPNQPRQQVSSSSIQARTRAIVKADGRTSIAAPTPTVDHTADPDTYHDVLHEHEWTSRMGYGYLPSTLQPESDESPSSTVQEMIRTLQALPQELSAVKSEALYFDLIYKRLRPYLDSESKQVSASLALVATSGQRATETQDCGVIVPLVDYSLVPPGADRQQELFLKHTQTPFSRLRTAIAIHAARRMLTTTDSSRHPVMSSIVASLLRATYVNADELTKKLSVSGADGSDLEVLFVHGLPTGNTWVCDHLEARRLAQRLLCVRSHDNKLASMYVTSNSRRIRMIWRLAFRAVQDQVRRRTVIIKSMALPARTRIVTLFGDLSSSWKHNVLLELCRSFKPLKARTILDACRVLSHDERLTLFHGLSAWLRFGDEVMDALPQGGELIDQLDQLQANIRAQEASADDDYAAIRRKLTFVATTARSKNADFSAETALTLTDPSSSFVAKSRPTAHVVAVTLGGSVAIRNGAVLLSETRKICGCSGLRTALQAVFDEEISHRVKSIEESRLNELDRRVTAVLLRRQSSLRQASRQGQHPSAASKITVQTADAEPLLLEDLSTQERESVEAIVAKYRQGFVQRMDSKKTQILSGAPTRRSSVTSLTSTTDVDVIDEASIEDLLQHDGVELMPQSSATNQKDVNTYPENDAILREVLMLATENRRLRDQNEELKASVATMDARVKKLKWQVSKGHHRADVGPRATQPEENSMNPSNNGAMTAKQLGFVWSDSIVATLKLPLDIIQSMPICAVQDCITRHFTDLQADVKRAEVVILQAREEREQADNMLRQRMGSGVTDIVEKLRDAEVEIRALQGRLKTLDADDGGSDAIVTHASLQASPVSLITEGQLSVAVADPKRLMRLEGPLACQFRIERSMRLAMEAAKANQTGTPVKQSDCVKILAKMYRRAARLDDATYTAPNFEYALSDSSDEDADSLAFMDVDGDSVTGSTKGYDKKASFITPLSASLPVSGGAGNGDPDVLVSTMGSDLSATTDPAGGKPPAAPRRRSSLKVSIPEPSGPKSPAAVAVTESVELPAKVPATRTVSTHASLPSMTLPAPSVSQPVTANTTEFKGNRARRGSWSTTGSAKPDKPLFDRGSVRALPSARSVPGNSDGNSLLPARSAIKSLPETVPQPPEGLFPSRSKSPPPLQTRQSSLRGRRGTSFVLTSPKRRTPSPSSLNGGVTMTPAPPSSVKKRPSIRKMASRRDTGSRANSVGTAPSGFEFRVVREQATIRSEHSNGLTEFEASAMIAVLLEEKLYRDGLADIQDKERQDVLDVCRDVLLEQYGMQSIADSVLAQLRSACVKFAPVNARCRLFATVLGDADPDALLGPAVDMMTSPSSSTAVLVENRRMAMDFLLHVIGFTLEIDASIKVMRARDLGLVKRLGPGVPGSGSPSDRCKLSKAKVSSVALKLLPKSSSSHWLATLRSAVTACSDSIDIDSFADVMMSLWYELHHGRMEVMVRSLQIANKAAKTLTIEGFMEVMALQHPESTEDTVTRIFYSIVPPGETKASFEAVLGMLLNLLRNSKTRVF